jgi:leucyl aminopeptidase
MEFTRFEGAVADWAVDVLAVGVTSSNDWSATPVVAELNKALSGVLSDAATAEGFEGKPGQSFVIHTHGRIAAKQVLLLGSTGDDWSGRSVAGRAARFAREKRQTSLGITGVDGASLSELVTGAELGHYTFDKWKRKNVVASKLSRIELQLDIDAAELAEAQGIVAGITLARDLVNEPPATLTPTAMAAAAQAIADEHDYEITIFDKATLVEKKMNLILAVSAGSVEEPRLIHLTYRPEGATKDTPSIAFVGKGLTFDAGGLCLKPTGAIEDMKIDMGGGAAVLGAMKAIAAVKPDVVVHGIVPSSENLVGGAAFKPGDCIEGYGGITVEILNTDAEGRLILADALAYAKEFGPSEIVDLATLTGAIVVALGPHRAGVYGANDDMANALVSSAKTAGESVWRMPLDKQLRKQLKSDIADIKNVGKRWGGSITAALFLHEFAGDANWGHIDLAGPAFADKTEDHIIKGGTGFGVAMLTEFARTASKRIS